MLAVDHRFQLGRQLGWGVRTGRQRECPALLSVELEAEGVLSRGNHDCSAETAAADRRLFGCLGDINLIRSRAGFGSGAAQKELDSCGSGFSG
jgi:hypothetical protein